jgi:hypothetical protein
MGTLRVAEWPHFRLMRHGRTCLRNTRSTVQTAAARELPLEFLGRAVDLRPHPTGFGGA